MPTMFQLQEKVADMLLGYSREKRELLEDRRRGADNKDKGTEYERHYGVLHLMLGAFKCRSSGEDGSAFTVSSNLVADVDDLYVARNELLTFSQVKDRQKLGWSEVEERFSEQLKELRKLGLLKFSTVQLVVSRRELYEKLKSEKPQQWKDVEVVHFANTDADFRAFTTNLTAREYDPIAEENARHHYYDAWRTLEFSATVGRVSRRAHRLSYGNLRPLDADVKLPPTVEYYLAGVEFLTSKVIGQRLYYAYRDEELAPMRWAIGSPNWIRFIDALSLAENLDYLGFLKLLNEIP